MNFLIINGPNLNLLGRREPEIYGSLSFDDYLVTLKSHYSEHTFMYVQSNHEGALIDALHAHGFSADGIVLNAGAYTHTSVALADAIRSVVSPVVEVHISNVFKREEFRHHSTISGACAGTIVGFGFDSYRLAVEALIALQRQ
jgi:3-dehydroquinate dehydratase-2